MFFHFFPVHIFKDDEFGVMLGSGSCNEVMQLDTIHMVSLAQDGRVVAATELKEGASSADINPGFFVDLLILDVPFRGGNIIILGSPADIHTLGVYQSKAYS